MNWIEDFITSKKINCNFARVGLYHAAYSHKHYELITKDVEKMKRDEGIETYAVLQIDI